MSGGNKIKVLCEISQFIKCRNISVIDFNLTVSKIVADISLKSCGKRILTGNSGNSAVVNIISIRRSLKIVPSLIYSEESVCTNSGIILEIITKRLHSGGIKGVPDF